MRAWQFGTWDDPNLRILCIALVLFGGLRLVWISDIPFINDEPQLILRAQEANHQGVLVRHGLRGTRGIDYGPLPTWIYQLGLAVFGNLILLAATKAFVITILCGLCLIWLASILRGLVPWIGATAFLSTYLWFYARDLWDNSFVIPLSAVALVSYFSHLNSGKFWPFAVMAVACTGLGLTHLMSLPIVIAISLHMAVFRREFLNQQAVRILVLGLFCLALAAPYLLHLSLHSEGVSEQSWAGQIRSLFFAVFGIRFFSGVGLTYFFGNDWLNPWEHPGLQLLIDGAVVLSALGIIFFVRGCLDFGREWRRHWPAKPAYSSGDPLKFHVGWVCSTALGVFVILCYANKLSGHPHYYNALWLPFFYFTWKGASLFWSEPSTWLKTLVMVWAVCLGTFLLGAMVRVHLGQGTRSLHYGPTLGNLIEVGQVLENRARCSELYLEAWHPRAFPHSIKAVRKAHGPISQASSGSKRTKQTQQETLIISYSRPKDQWHGGITARAIRNQGLRSAKSPP